MKSLIVDDVLLIRKVLVRILNEYGTCDIAENGDIAITKFEKALDTKPYNLICMDIMMPNTDGLKAVEVIRLLEKENHIHNSDRVKIIMITTVSDIDTVKSSFNFGCDGYIVKPLDLVVFRKKLEKLSLISI